MTLVEQLANAALVYDALLVRSISQELCRAPHDFSMLAMPVSGPPRTVVVAAALLELIAERHSLIPPSWTAMIGALDQPFHLLAAAERMPRLRAACEAEAPLPLRRRNLFAPADYLSDA